MGRRGLLAQSSIGGDIGGEDVYLTMNATTEENKRAFQIMREEAVFDGMATYDWSPDNGNTKMFVSGVAEGKTFVNVPINKAWMDCDYEIFSVYFDGRDDLGITPVAWLYPDGTFAVYDDD